MVGRWEGDEIGGDGEYNTGTDRKPVYKLNQIRICIKIETVSICILLPPKFSEEFLNRKSKK